MYFLRNTIVREPLDQLGAQRLILPVGTIADARTVYRTGCWRQRGYIKISRCVCMRTAIDWVGHEQGEKGWLYKWTSKGHKSIESTPLARDGRELELESLPSSQRWSINPKYTTSYVNRTVRRRFFLHYFPFSLSFFPDDLVYRP